MNKRLFLKLVSSVMAMPILSPLMAWAAGDKLKNWAGNVKYGTDRLYSATSLEQAQEYVKKQKRLKVLGTRHCFNHIADSQDGFLSLRQMDKVMAVDGQAGTGTASGGRG